MSHTTAQNATPTKTTANSIGLASITLSNGINYIFYYNESNQIASLSGKDTDSAYSERTVTTPPDGATISQNLVSPLAATALTNNSGSLTEIRLYYVAAGNYIKELGSADGVTWSKGSLDNKKLQIASYGGLSASFGTQEGIKIFFVDASSGKFTQAYINTTTREWRTKTLV